MRESDVHPGWLDAGAGHHQQPAPLRRPQGEGHTASDEAPPDGWPGAAEEDTGLAAGGAPTRPIAIPRLEAARPFTVDVAGSRQPLEIHLARNRLRRRDRDRSPPAAVERPLGVARRPPE